LSRIESTEVGKRPKKGLGGSLSVLESLEALEELDMLGFGAGRVRLSIRGEEERRRSNGAVKG